jgi:prepilin peptidase CpaA
MLLSVLSAVLGVAFLGLCVVAALSDVRSLTIPNKLNIAIAALFIPAALLSGLPWEILGGHLVAGLAAFVIGFGLFSFRIIGGGDAKMVPAVMLWMGPGAALPFLFFMAIAGGALTLLILGMRRAIPAGMVPAFFRMPLEPEAGVPYGVAIAAGAILAGASSPLLGGLYAAFGWHS